MKFFSSPFNQTTCGKIKLPAGNTGKMKLLLIDKDNNKCAVNFLHNFDVQLSNSAFFSTATSIINCDIVPDHFVLYLEENNTYSWILENSIQVNIYDLTTGSLLATKVFGTLDDLILLEPSNFIDKPSLVLSKCGYDSTINLNKSFIKVEFRSLCGDSVLPACCDQLPESVSISGYDILCIPLRENYEVPDFTTTTTTLPPQEDKIKILQQPYIIQSRDVEKYYLYAFVDTKYGNDFQYWWERSEDNAKWERITELKSSRAFSQISLEQVKEKDYFYRLYIHLPSSKISNSVFYDYIDYSTTTTTTTTTTTIPPLPLSPPTEPLNLAVSGGGFRQTFLTWNEPAYDGRSDRTKYGLNITLHQQDTLAYSVDIPPSSTSWYQDIESEYDGILLDYSLRAHNFFGYSPAATVTGIQTLLLAPPTVVNFSVSAQQDPYRMELDWDATGVNENYPLLGHTVKYRPSGSSSAYTVSSYDGTETQLTILDSNTFDNCETYEFEVTASNSIGESNPASGYARMAFLPSTPVNLGLEIADAGGGNIDLDFYWNPPIDSGRCEILNYVYQYRDANDLDWSLPITVYTTGVQAQSIPSGDYVFRVAAVNVVGTGNYSAYGDWIQVGEGVETLDRPDYKVSILDSLTRMSTARSNYSNLTKGYVFDFNGCSWVESLGVTLNNTNSIPDSILFNDGNSVAFFTNRTTDVTIYNYSNGVWSSSVLTSAGSINDLSTPDDYQAYNYSSNLSHWITGNRNLHYWNGLSSLFSNISLNDYIPTDDSVYRYDIYETSISDDGSTLSILYYRDQVENIYNYEYFLRFYSISGLSLTQIGDDVILPDITDPAFLLPKPVTQRLRHDGNELLFIVGEYDPTTSIQAFKLTYSSLLNSWSIDEYTINSPLSFNSTVFSDNLSISSDLNTVSALWMDVFGIEDEYAIQAYTFTGSSFSFKGAYISAPSFVYATEMSNNGHAIVFDVRPGGSGPTYTYVYRYTASELEFPPCVPTTTTAPSTTTPAPSGSYTVSGAGDTEFNGTYTETGNHGGYPYYEYDDGTDNPVWIYFDSIYFQNWAISYGTDAVDDMPPFYYQIDTAGETPSRSSNWDNEQGQVPVPSVT